MNMSQNMVDHTTSGDHLSSADVASSARIQGCARNCFCLGSEESENTSIDTLHVCIYAVYYIVVNIVVKSLHLSNKVKHFSNKLEVSGTADIIG